MISIALPFFVVACPTSPSPLLTPQGDEIVLCVEPWADAQQIAQAYGVQIDSVVQQKHLWLLDPPAGLDPAALDTLCEALEDELGSIFAEFNGDVLPPEQCVHEGQVVPQQCSIGFVDGTPTQQEYTGQSLLQAIKAQQALALSNWTPITVAVIDTGLDLAHPVFAGKLASNGYDFITETAAAWDVPSGDTDGDGMVDEALGHGTHVAGTVLLVYPNARILPYRVLNSNGSGKAFDVARAIFRAVDEGAQVINLSLTMSEPSLIVSAALEYAAHHGVSVFVAAGNTGSNVPVFPASYESSLLQLLDLPFLPPSSGIDLDHLAAVTAVNSSGKKADFAAWGPHVDLAAPGVDVYSATWGGGYGWWSGTSMATAVASGGAALTLSAVCWTLPPWLQSILSELLAWTAQPLDALNPAYAGGLGAGRINVFSSSLIASFFCL